MKQDEHVSATTEADVWLTVLRCVTALAIALIFAIAGSCSYTNYRISVAPDPLATACAMGNNLNACLVTGRQPPKDVEQ